VQLDLIAAAVEFGAAAMGQLAGCARQDPAGVAPLVAEIYATLLEPFLASVIAAPRVFEPSVALAYAGHLLSIIVACHATVQDIPDAFLGRLLEAIVVSMQVVSDGDGFPSEACAQAAFYTTIVTPGYPRMVARRLFEEVFLSGDRLQFVLDAFLYTETYSEGITFLLDRMGERFPDDLAVSEAAVRFLARVSELVVGLAPWAIDRLSYLRTASLYFGALPEDAQLFVQGQSEDLMVECNPGSDHADTVGFTIGVEILSRILRSGGRATERQTAILSDFGAQTMGNIGLEAVSVVFPEAANAIVPSATAQLLQFLQYVEREKIETSDTRDLFTRQCLLLEEQIPQTTFLDFDAFRELVPFILDVDICMHTSELCGVIGQAVARGPANFGREVIQSLLAGANDSWDVKEAPLSRLVLSFVSVHPTALSAQQAVSISSRLLLSEWSDFEPEELGDVVDLMCAFVHLGLREPDLIRGFLEHIPEVEREDTKRMHVLVRFHASMFLAMGYGLPDLLGDWIGMIEAGKFSSPYLRLLTVLSFRRLVGEGQQGLDGYVDALTGGGFAENDEDALSEPDGMQSLLAAYLHE
jgi:hypothetical protein